MNIAENVAGANHNLKYIQAPFNMIQNEALTGNNQLVAGEQTNLLGACEQLGLRMFTSGPFYQGRLVTSYLPEELGVKNPPARALQLFKERLQQEGAWAGQAFSTKKLGNLEANLEILRLGETMPTDELDLILNVREMQHNNRYHSLDVKQH